MNFTLSKLNIQSDKLLTKEEQLQVEDSLKNQGRKLISMYAKPAKNDYNHDFDRGTVFYTEDNYNYSYHKVIIPDGTIVEERNFFQKDPHTKAIKGKNLTFIECNLVNVEIDPSWIIQSCNTTQVMRVVKEDVVDKGVTTRTISHQVERNGVFVEEATYAEVLNTAEEKAHADLSLSVNKAEVV